MGERADEFPCCILYTVAIWLPSFVGEMSLVVSQFYSPDMGIISEVRVAVSIPLGVLTRTREL